MQRPILNQVARDIGANYGEMLSLLDEGRRNGVPRDTLDLIVEIHFYECGRIMRASRYRAKPFARALRLEMQQYR